MRRNFALFIAIAVLIQPIQPADWQAAFKPPSVTGTSDFSRQAIPAPALLDHLTRARLARHRLTEWFWTASQIPHAPPEPGTPRPPRLHERARTVLLFALGSVVGFLSSLIGIGGGPLIVPVLGLSFPLTAEQAAATSNAAIAPIAIMSAVAYQLVHPHTLDLSAAFSLTLGSLSGAWTIGKRKLNDKTLKALMVGVISLIGLKYLQLPIPWPWTPSFDPGVWGLNSGGFLFHAGLGATGFLVGSLAALLGIGGGVLLVPAMIGLFGLSPQAAAATSLASIPVTAGTVAYRKRNSVAWGLARRLVVFGLLGSALGFKVVPPLSGDSLKQVLGGVILISCLLFLITPALRDFIARRRAKRTGFKVYTPFLATVLAVWLTLFHVPFHHSAYPVHNHRVSSAA